ncbi:hypothetical protein [Telluribacter sp.]|jgi:intein-encoded DNA endonuclease-like protein|uniref:hypothetical protein n=1 Tax=Telluribacter sp. TaxID=1978767 RepID=UPI002E120197|nr:hypothetical protein [Telluribacter sp.]
MLTNRNTYDKAVVEAIMKCKEFSGTEVHNLRRLKSLFYKEDEYQKVIQQVKDKKLEELNELDIHGEGFREYLDIMKFQDQSGTAFIVTIYDSDEMWQDPQVLDVFQYEQ